jgi:hypothetical protein
MPRYPETQALLEQALRHILTEESNLLKRDDRAELTEIIASLNHLALKTSSILAEGINNITSTASLLTEAKRIETLGDDVSELHWTHIPVSVSAIYERIEKSLVKKSGKQGLVADTRAHYHNLRVSSPLKNSV